LIDRFSARQKKCCVLSEEKVDDIDIQLETGPRKYFHGLAVQSWVSKSLPHRETKLSEVYQYKTRGVKHLLPVDSEIRTTLLFSCVHFVILSCTVHYYE
jgi:hypothetical protein